MSVETAVQNVSAESTTYGTTSAEDFDLDSYLLQFKVELFEIKEGRVIETRLHPLMFALTYLQHHLKGDETDGKITFSDFHLDLCRDAVSWIRKPKHPRQYRDAYVAPRNCGKSTWLFLILPLWAAAHGHIKFAAAFADSAGQAETHLATFKSELENNRLLRHDFPELCEMARRPRGMAEADSRQMLKTKSGFVFAAKGIDAASLGLKVGNQRPDLLIFDDIEKSEGVYSLYQVEQRLRTLEDAILPLNEFARVVIAGTVTLSGSIIHQLVKTAQEPNTPKPEWVHTQNITTHYYPSIVKRADGSERSVWPAKWSMAYLNSIRHTRDFLKNFQNSPMGADGDYWGVEDIEHRLCPESALARTCISIDPAITDGNKSDWSGIAVLSEDGQGGPIYVRYATQVHLTGRQLRSRVEALLRRFPEIRVLVVEVNQGGQVWEDVFRGLPVKLRTTWSSAPKHVRAGELLELYQTRRVVHSDDWDDKTCIEQMVGFPKAPNDDMVDAVGAGARYLTGALKSKLVVQTIA